MCAERNLLIFCFLFEKKDLCCIFYGIIRSNRIIQQVQHDLSEYFSGQRIQQKTFAADFPHCSSESAGCHGGGGGRPDAWQGEPAGHGGGIAGDAGLLHPHHCSLRHCQRDRGSGRAVLGQKGHPGAGGYFRLECSVCGGGIAGVFCRDLLLPGKTDAAFCSR